MGSKYKKELERTWEGKTMSDVKIKTLQKGTVCAIMSDEVVDKEGYQWQQIKVV